ncbi:MAG: hypothetical protein A2284_15855 [Deltaproteobacteria bacterium RIFOXYA12_FULL_61_11]|nr:MAG: hypothetical protein A2284_15855 [Deltaproteobacteria bacterium RIFOXYA12_FULL_61_11]
MQPPTLIEGYDRCGLRAEQLGAPEFRTAHGCRYAYIAGAMFSGIAGVTMLERLAGRGLLGFFGSGGLSLQELEAALAALTTKLSRERPWGCNLLHNLYEPELEERTVDLLLRYQVRRISASAYTRLTLPLVRYRVTGLQRTPGGEVNPRHQLLAKLSRPELAEQFLAPPPAKLLSKLFEDEAITREEYELAQNLPMADAITVEADSGGHTDKGVSTVLLPEIQRLRDRARERHHYSPRVHIGAAGGLGTPMAVAAMFYLGADYVLTGSVNHCTVEAATSEPVKDLLERMSPVDVTMAPAPDLFELGAKVQVLRRGVLYPGQANKLYELYRTYQRWEDLPLVEREKLEAKVFRRPFVELLTETLSYWDQRKPELAEKARAESHLALALVFRWYLGKSSRWAINGDPERKQDYQIHTGPALGAFNSWVEGTPYQSWRARHVDEVAELLMQGAAVHAAARGGREGGGFRGSGPGEPRPLARV